MARRGSIAKELWLFIRESRKWWMIPVLLVVLLLLAVVVLSSTGAVPFMYTVF